MRLLRDLGRRKLRSTLTITGILIGIMALVVFGSMANKIDSLVKGGSDYYKDKVVVSAKGGTMGVGGVLSMADAATIGKLDGVDVAAPAVSMLLSDDQTRHEHGRPADDRRRPRRRRPGPRDVPPRLRERTRPHRGGRGQQRRRPGLGPRPPAQRQGRRLDHPAGRLLRDRRHPRPHPDRP